MNKIIYLIFVVLLFNVNSFGKIFYDMDVDFNLEKGEIYGKVKISSDKKEEVDLSTKGFEIKGLDKKKFVLIPEKPVLFTFKRRFHSYSSKNIITDEAIYLFDNWYPEINRLAFYRLTVNIPVSFVGISESEEIVQKNNGKSKRITFLIDKPLENIHFIASKDFSVKEKNFNGITVATYFFKKDRDIADTYIEKTFSFIRKYESIVGRFPFKRFSIVENFFPTGYSMPTLTLLGQQIVRFPFITETSLPHEILHQWFGCSVYVDFSKGNWSEGLTTYLSDHFFSKNPSEYRKNLILKYMAYVNKSNEYPLKDFLYKRNSIDEAIGYGKSAMFFHFLRKKVGDNDFFSAVRKFYSENRFKRASWEDIKNAFQTASKEDLSGVFYKWLNKKGLFKVKVLDAKTYIDVDGFFKLKLHLEKDNDFKVPLSVSFYNKQKDFYINKNKKILTLKDIPISVTVDKNYDIFRELEEKETPPALYFFFGDKNPVIISDKAFERVYSPVLDMFLDGKVIYPENFKFSDLKRKNIIILGRKNPVLKRIFGGSEKEEGTYIKGYKNPFQEKKFIFVVNAENKRQLLKILRKSRHYGKYSFVKLGKALYRKKEGSEKGINILLREPVLVGTEKGLSDFNKLIKDLSTKDVIYIGEQHTKFSHHAIQYQIIKRLYEIGKDLVIGMEMFDRKFQKFLDMYINGKISENDMLKKTRYFKQWRYDYNYYKPILRFAKEKKIPVIALNIGIDIVDKVAKKGLDGLSKEEKKYLPKSMDFSNLKYRDLLLRIYAMHTSGHLKNFDYFYQSQIVWDETMAETISKYMKKYPTKTFIVLAGNGHLSFGYGIPDRVKRRIDLNQVILLNDEKAEKGKGDYFLFPEEFKGVTSKKLGVYIEETEKGLKVDTVIKTSVAEKSGIKKGDIIVSFNGKAIKSIEDLKILLISPPEKSSITVIRGGKKLNIEIHFSSK